MQPPFNGPSRALSWHLSLHSGDGEERCSREGTDFSLEQQTNPFDKVHVELPIDPASFPDPNPARIVLRLLLKVGILLDSLAGPLSSSDWLREKFVREAGFG